MVSVVSENWSNTKISDELEKIDVLDIDINALLMSLLQDSLVENGDDERLLSVIKSLEAEIIDPHNINHVMNVDDPISTVVEPMSSEGYLEDCQSSDAWQTNDQDCSISDGYHDLDFSWINGVEMVSSPMGDDINMWCMDPCGDHELDNRSVEFGEVRDYYYYCQQVFDVVVPLEEPGYSISLWQETYDSVMYG